MENTQCFQLSVQVALFVTSDYGGQVFRVPHPDSRD